MARWQPSRSSVITSLVAQAEFLTAAPFPHPAHRTGHADLPHPALGQDLTPSPTPHRAQAQSVARARSARRGVRVDRSTPALPDLVLVAQPPAQPRCGVVVERSVCAAERSYPEVVRPAAQRAVQLAHHRRGLLPSRLQGRELMDSDISSPPCLLRLLPAGAVAGWALHPLESAAFSRRTPEADTRPSKAIFSKRSVDTYVAHLHEESRHASGFL